MKTFIGNGIIFILVLTIYKLTSEPLDLKYNVFSDGFQFPELLIDYGYFILLYMVIYFLSRFIYKSIK